MRRRFHLDPDDLIVEGFTAGSWSANLAYTTEPGTWNDTTAGCCAPSGSCPPTDGGGGGGGTDDDKEPVEKVISAILGPPYC